MTLEQILAALRIPWTTANRGKEIATAPSFDAELRRDRDKIFVWVYRNLRSWPLRNSAGRISDYIDNVLHEAMHAFVGPSSTDDEGVLMAVQWQVMQELQGDEFASARKGFARYGHVWSADVGDEIGDTDEFLETATWKVLVEEAIGAGFLVRRDERLHVVWGLGADPQWRTYRLGHKCRRGSSLVEEPDVVRRKACLAKGKASKA